MATRKKKRTEETKRLAQTTAKAAVARGEGLVALVVRRKVDIAEAFYDIGLALRDLLRKKLYAALGHASFDDLLTKRKVFGPSAAYQLIEIVDHYTRDQALTIGSAEKAYALSRYAAATKESDPPATLLTSGVRVGKERDPVPVSELSVRDLEALTRTAKSKKGSHRTKRDEDAEAVHREAKALGTKLGKRAGGRIRVEAKKRGKTWWAVIELTVSRLRVLVGAPISSRNTAPSQAAMRRSRVRT